MVVVKRQEGMDSMSIEKYELLKPSEIARASVDVF